MRRGVEEIPVNMIVLYPKLLALFRIIPVVFPFLLAIPSLFVLAHLTDRRTSSFLSARVRYLEIKSTLGKNSQESKCLFFPSASFPLKNKRTIGTEDRFWTYSFGILKYVFLLFLFPFFFLFFFSNQVNRK